VNIPLRIIALATASLVLTGCAGSAAYVHKGPRNVVFTKTVGEDGFLESTGAFVFVNRPKPDCSDWEPVGRNSFQESRMEMAFPNDQLFFINVAVLKSASNTTTILRNETLFKAKKGHRYKFDVYYKDDSYDFKLYEKDSPAADFREIEPMPWSPTACKKMEARS